MALAVGAILSLPGILIAFAGAGYGMSPTVAGILLDAQPPGIIRTIQVAALAIFSGQQSAGVEGR